MRDSKKRAGWRLRLPEFDFEVLNRAGVKQLPLEALLRLIRKGMDESQRQGDVPVLTITKV